jgi:hypothetical protein
VRGSIHPQLPSRDYVPATHNTFDPATVAAPKVVEPGVVGVRLHAYRWARAALVPIIAVRMSLARMYLYLGKYTSIDAHLAALAVVLLQIVTEEIVL